MLLSHPQGWWMTWITAKVAGNTRVSEYASQQYRSHRALSNTVSWHIETIVTLWRKKKKRSFALYKTMPAWTEQIYSRCIMSSNNKALFWLHTTKTGVCSTHWRHNSFSMSQVQDNWLLTVVTYPDFSRTYYAASCHKCQTQQLSLDIQ